MNVNPNLIEQAAAVGFAAVREFGHTTGRDEFFDTPTWQICPAKWKRAWRLRALAVLMASPALSLEALHEAARPAVPDLTAFAAAPAWSVFALELFRQNVMCFRNV